MANGAQLEKPTETNAALKSVFDQLEYIRATGAQFTFEQRKIALVDLKTRLEELKNAYTDNTYVVQAVGNWNSRIDSVCKELSKGWDGKGSEYSQTLLNDINIELTKFKGNPEYSIQIHAGNEYTDTSKVEDIYFGKQVLGKTNEANEFDKARAKLTKTVEELAVQVSNNLKNMDDTRYPENLLTQLETIAATNRALMGDDGSFTTALHEFDNVVGKLDPAIYGSTAEWEKFFKNMFSSIVLYGPGMDPTNPKGGIIESPVFSQEIIGSMVLSGDPGNKEYNVDGVSELLATRARAIASLELGSDLFKRYLAGKIITNTESRFDAKAAYAENSKDYINDPSEGAIFKINTEVRNSILQGVREFSVSEEMTQEQIWAVIELANPDDTEWQDNTKALYDPADVPESIAKINQALAARTSELNYQDQAKVDYTYFKLLMDNWKSALQDDNKKDAFEYALKALYGSDLKILKDFASQLGLKTENENGGALSGVDTLIKIIDYFEKEENFNSTVTQFNNFSEDKPLSSAVLLTAAGASFPTTSKKLPTDNGYLSMDAFDFICNYSAMQWSNTKAGSGVSDERMEMVLYKAQASMPTMSQALLFQDPETLNYMFSHLGDDQLTFVSETLLTNMNNLFQSVAFERRMTLMREYYEEANDEMQKRVGLLSEEEKQALGGADATIKVNRKDVHQYESTFQNQISINAANGFVHMEMAGTDIAGEYSRNKDQQTSGGVRPSAKIPTVEQTNELIWGGVGTESLTSALQTLYNKKVNNLKNEEKEKRAIHVTYADFTGNLAGKDIADSEDRGGLSANIRTREGGTASGRLSIRDYEAVYSGTDERIPRRDSQNVDVNFDAANIAAGGIAFNRALFKYVSSPVTTMSMGGEDLVITENSDLSAQLNALMPKVGQVVFKAYSNTHQTTDFSRFANLAGLFDQVAQGNQQYDQIKSFCAGYAADSRGSDTNAFEWGTGWDEREALQTYVYNLRNVHWNNDPSQPTILSESQATSLRDWIQTRRDNNEGFTVAQFNNEFDSVVGSGGTITDRSVITGQLSTLINNSSLYASEKTDLINKLLAIFDANGQLTKQDYLNAVADLRKNAIAAGVDQFGGDLFVHTGNGIWSRMKIDVKRITAEEMKKLEDFRANFLTDFNNITSNGDRISGQAQLNSLIGTENGTDQGRLGTYAISDADKDYIRSEIRKIANASNGYTITKDQIFGNDNASPPVTGIIPTLISQKELGNETIHEYARLYQEKLWLTTDFGYEFAKKGPRGYYYTDPNAYEKTGFFIGWQTRPMTDAEITASGLYIKDKGGSEAMLFGLQQSDARAVVCGFYDYAPTQSQAAAGIDGDKVASIKYAELEHISLMVYGKVRGSSELYGGEIRGKHLKGDVIYSFDPDAKTYTYWSDLGFSTGGADYKGFFKQTAEDKSMTQNDYIKTGHRASIELGNGMKLSLYASYNMGLTSTNKPSSSLYNSALSLATSLDSIHEGDLRDYRSRMTKHYEFMNRLLSLHSELQRYKPDLSGTYNMSLGAYLEKDGMFKAGASYHQLPDKKNAMSVLFSGHLPWDGFFASTIFDMSDANSKMTQKGVLQYESSDKHTLVSVYGVINKDPLSDERFGASGRTTMFGKYVAGELAIGSHKMMVAKAMFSPTSYLDVWGSVGKINDFETYVLGTNLFITQNMKLISQLNQLSGHGISADKFNMILEGKIADNVTLSITGEYKISGGAKDKFGTDPIKDYMIYAKISWWPK